MIPTIRRRLLKYSLTLLPIFLITATLPAQLLSLDPTMPEEIHQARTTAIQWLSDQIVPNSIVPQPAPSRRKLILSYRIPTTDPAHRYLSGRSFIYDDALAIVAFTMAGEYRKAESIISALERLILEDGSLWFAYNTQNSWPSEADHNGAVVRSGAIAWVGYAIVYYLQKRLQNDPHFLETDMLARRYVATSQRIANYLTDNQIISTADLRHGLVTGGTASYTIKMSTDADKILEEYSVETIDWVSMEHNIDAYFFLRDLGRISHDPTYSEKAALIKEGLTRMWSSTAGQLFRGIKGTQTVDTALPLDGASWGALFFNGIGDHNRARICLETVSRFYSATASVKGYGPYYKERVFESEAVNRFIYKDRKEMTWQELQVVWGEGSLGVAAAFSRVGKADKALDIIEDIIKMQQNGGIQYSSQSVPYQFSVYPSVASTAWLVITTQLIMFPNEIFWGP